MLPDILRGQNNERRRNFVSNEFSILDKPDGRIESIKSFGGSAEGGDESGEIKTIFTATVQSRSLNKEIHDRAAASVLVSVFQTEDSALSELPIHHWKIGICAGIKASMKN